jgi:hypothetical protein
MQKLISALQKLISAIGSAFPVVLLVAVCVAVGSLARYHVIHREPEQAFEAEKVQAFEVEKRTATHESILGDAKFLKGKEVILIEQLKVDRAATPMTPLIEERIKEREADLADTQKRLKAGRKHPRE